MKPSVELRPLINGYQVAQAIHVAATLGIADRLRDGARSSDELAAEADAHPEALYRLLRALASVGVFHEEDERRFSLTPMGECLCTDASEPLGGWAAFIGRPYHWEAWGNLLHSVRTGENAFRHVHGTNVWEYRTAHPEESPIFDRAMTDLTRTSNRDMLDAYDFGRFLTVVDVGGGRGALLAALLTEYPTMTGILFDQPHIVEGAREILAAAGVGDRSRIVGGSFFETIPEGGDAYVLKAIIHDWGDVESIAILRNCRLVVPEDGRLLVIERLVGSPNEDPLTKFGDLNMLVSPGGKERTIDEFTALFAAAGFALGAATATPSGLAVIEGLPSG